MGRAMKLLRSEAEKATTVLFVGARNAGATLVAEALVRQRRSEGIRAYSAGISPADGADPRVFAALAKAEIDYDGLWPKHWLGFLTDHRVKIEHLVIIGTPRIPSVLCNYAVYPDIHHWPDPFIGLRDRHTERWFRQWQKRVEDLLQEINARKRMEGSTSLGSTVINRQS